MIVGKNRSARALRNDVPVGAIEFAVVSLHASAKFIGYFPHLAQYLSVGVFDDNVATSKIKPCHVTVGSVT
ncbi:hypothetical protein C0Z18_07785 [Trinickia dabaoshanensis]|uniref:Uncharacterized protein n=1 Tax=Trinickia dabaoshanensis TaxID=564714 RepID=A0A2N7VX68_9BURK|nr:hypothetical protein C0Z18_07785 [Trinickia dabaoshanensis]